MGFDEEAAIKAIKEASSFDDYGKIIQVLSKINPDVFKSENTKKRFKELLSCAYSLNDLDYVKNLLRNFLGDYDKKPGVHLWFCSKQFKNKFFSKEFDEIDRKKIIMQINKIIHGGADNQSIPLGEFIETPHGMHFPLRIIWFKNNQGIFIADAFHKNKIDNFYKLIHTRKIHRSNYGNYSLIEKLIAI